MGAECSCVKGDDEEVEYVIGSGIYSFKKWVCNKLIKIILIIIIYRFYQKMRIEIYITEKI